MNVTQKNARKNTGQNIAKPVNESLLSGRKNRLLIAARGSALSVTQVSIVQDLLRKEGAESEFIPVVTEGDHNRNVPLIDIGGRGLFVREVEKKLLSKEADIAVHSAKDMPRELADGLTVGGVPEAADPRDCIVFAGGTKLSGAIVAGTGSMRRTVQLNKLFPEMEFRNIRGNIDTRLRKLRNGEYDAIVLAKAGLDRLSPDLDGLQIRILDIDECIPAPCQGILACECRSEDTLVREILNSITDEYTMRRFTAERFLMELMQTDCHEAFGVYARTSGDDLIIDAFYNHKKASVCGKNDAYKELCEKAKTKLLG